MAPLIRKVGSILVPEVKNNGDWDELEQQFKLHALQKVVLTRMMTEGTTLEEMLDFCRDFYDGKEFDEHVENVVTELIL